MKIKYIFITSLTVCCVAFGQQDRSFMIENHLRIGYDDNVTQLPTNNTVRAGTTVTNKIVNTLYYSDIFNLSGKYKLSGRTDLIVYWQPELRYYATNDLEDNAFFCRICI